MKRFEKVIRTLGRYVVVFGVALAVACASVIVANAPALVPGKTVPPAEVVHLDPVTVTISADRFDEIRAEAEAATKVVHVYGSGPKEV
ncbi:MAG: hypothetical protein ACR2GP_10360 [Burkholderiaceae bacterium]